MTTIDSAWGLWLKRWAGIVGVENPVIVTQHYDNELYDGISPYSVTISFTDHNIQRSAVLFPRDVAEVVYGGIHRDIRDAKFDDQNNLTFNARWR